MHRLRPQSPSVVEPNVGPKVRETRTWPKTSLFWRTDEKVTKVLPAVRGSWRSGSRGPPLNEMHQFSINIHQVLVKKSITSSMKSISFCVNNHSSYEILRGKTGRLKVHPAETHSNFSGKQSNFIIKKTKCVIVLNGKCINQQEIAPERDVVLRTGLWQNPSFSAEEPSISAD